MDNYIRVYDNVIHNSQEYIDTFSTRTYKDTIHEEKKDERKSTLKISTGSVAQKAGTGLNVGV